MQIQDKSWKWMDEFLEIVEELFALVLDFDRAFELCPLSIIGSRPLIKRVREWVAVSVPIAKYPLSIRDWLTD